MSCGCKKTREAVSRAAGNVAKGVVHLPQAVLGPTATKEVIRERTAVCKPCPHRQTGHKAFCGHPVFGDPDGGCGCVLKLKRRTAEKTCDKWAR